MFENQLTKNTALVFSSSSSSFEAGKGRSEVSSSSLSSIRAPSSSSCSSSQSGTMLNAFNLQPVVLDRDYFNILIRSSKFLVFLISQKCTYNLSELCIIVNIDDHIIQTLQVDTNKLGRFFFYIFNQSLMFGHIIFISPESI